MPHTLVNASAYAGRSFPNGDGNTECVEFIKQTLAAPATAIWREGAKVTRLAAGEKDPIAKGTAIATFVNGRYPQHGSRGKHAAIYLGQNEHGIQVVDQWRKQGVVKPRTIYWHSKVADLSNNGNAFSVIEW